jgi:hypothetical protein
MYGVRFAGYQAVFVERNKYAPWGRGVRAVARPSPAFYVWRKGNGKFDPKEKP